MQKQVTANHLQMYFLPWKSFGIAVNQLWLDDSSPKKDSFDWMYTILGLDNLMKLVFSLFSVFLGVCILFTCVGFTLKEINFISE